MSFNCGIGRRLAMPQVWWLAVAASMILACCAGSASKPPQSVDNVKADLKAAKLVVSFADQDKMFTVSRSDLVGVSLNGAWYNVASSTPGVLSLASGPVLTTDRFTIATFRALNVGQALVTANTKACSDCAGAEAVFRVQILVTAGG